MLAFLWIAVFFLTVYAAVIILFTCRPAIILRVTGRYPRTIFDFLMELNRWCYRVLAYVALMTDEYPPFRLDIGGADPANIPTVEPSPV